MLRKQSPGKQKPWKEIELKAGLEHFYNNHKRYPTAAEVDDFIYLPSARSIQRSYGGLIKLRKKLGLKSQNDFRKDIHSSKRARNIIKQDLKSKNEIYSVLVKKFGPKFVHRDYEFSDDGRIHLDFYIDSKKRKFGLDIINPGSRHSLIGCLNAKIKSYSNRESKIPTIIIISGIDLSEGEIQDILKNKSNKLPAYCRVVLEKDLGKMLE